jgi:ABC-type multidrug transport system fused ATPase/permease subunit
VIVLEKGVITEVGTTGELLERGGLYAEMSRMQRLQKELD